MPTLARVVAPLQGGLTQALAAMKSFMQLIVTAVLVLTAFPIAATSTMCMFYVPSGAPVADIEFIGYEELGGILIQGKMGPRSLPALLHGA